MLDDQVIDATPCLEGFLSDLRRVLVADDGVEGCDDTDAIADIVTALVLVSRDAIDAEGAEGVEAIDQ